MRHLAALAGITQVTACHSANDSSCATMPLRWRQDHDRPVRHSLMGAGGFIWALIPVICACETRGPGLLFSGSAGPGQNAGAYNRALAKARNRSRIRPESIVMSRAQSPRNTGGRGRRRRPPRAARPAPERPFWTPGLSRLPSPPPGSCSCTERLPRGQRPADPSLPRRTRCRGQRPRRGRSRSLPGWLAAPVSSPDQARVALATVDTVPDGAKVTLTLLDSTSAAIARQGSVTIAGVPNDANILVTPVFAAGFCDHARRPGHYRARCPPPGV